MNKRLQSHLVSPGQFCTFMRRHGLEEVLHPLTDSYQAVASFLFLYVVLLLLSPLLCIPGMLFLFGGT